MGKSQMTTDTNIYSNDEYVSKNPTLHEEDANWKLEHIIPQIDKIIIEKGHTGTEIVLLDVGGGTGTILQEIAKYISKEHNLTVKKIIIDLSPKALEIQTKNNADYYKALNEDISKTSLSDKEVDITLMIDVLEHIPNPIMALQEIKRVSKTAIFKIPLESNIFENIFNILTNGKVAKKLEQQYGHVNRYRTGKFISQIKRTSGKVVELRYTKFYTIQQKSLTKSAAIRAKLARYTSRVSPKISASLYGDFIVTTINY
jgi:ubiquinone/menaquinone biosynthesis C-methylase UbiE